MPSARRPPTTASARFSFTMKPGLASTKCGSSVGLARVVTDARLPPISVAIEPKSGVVATTSSFAWAAGARKMSAHTIRKGETLFIAVSGLTLLGIDDSTRLRTCARHAHRAGTRLASKPSVGHRTTGRDHNYIAT